MHDDPTRNGPVIGPGYLALAISATALTYLLLTMGGIVCVTESGRGCAGWPRCDGSLFPPPHRDAIIEYSHRLVAGLTVPVVFVSAIVGWRKFWSLRWVSRPPVVAVVLMLGVGALGAIGVLRGLSPAFAALDRGLALAALGLMVTATVMAWSQQRRAGLPDRLSFRTPFALLSCCTVAAVLALLSSGVLVAGTESTMRCLGWPLPVGSSPTGWPELARLGLTGMAGVLVIALVARGWRRRRTHPALSRAGLTVGGLFLIEVVIAWLIVALGPGSFLLGASVAATVALWAALVALAILAGMEAPDGASIAAGRTPA